MAEDYTVCEVVNLSDDIFIWTWDGKEYKLGPHERKHLVRGAALHGRKKSIYKYDPNTERIKHCLAVVGEHPIVDVSLSAEDKLELIDRTTGGVFGGKVQHQKIGNFEERGPVGHFGGHSAVTGSDSPASLGALATKDSDFEDE